MLSLNFCHVSLHEHPLISHSSKTSFVPLRNPFLGIQTPNNLSDKPQGLWPQLLLIIK